MDLSTDEHALFEGHPSWRSTLGFYLKGLLVAVIAGGIGLVAAGAGAAVAAGGGIFVLVLIAGFVKRMTTTYTITNRRLHIKKGFIAQKQQETRIASTTNVTVSQSFLERILGVGTVNFDTAGVEHADLFAFSGVADPNGVTQAVNRAVVEHEQEGRATQDTPPPAQRPT